jgi:uncharacterized protein
LNSQQNSDINASSGDEEIRLRFKINKKVAYIIFVLVGCITAFFGYKTSQLEFSYDIESFFSKTDAEYLYYKDYINRFEGENNFILVGIKNEDKIDNKEFLQKVNKLSLVLENNDFINKAISPTNMTKKVVTPLGMTISVPLIHIEDEGKIKKDIANLYADGKLVNSFLSVDQKSITIFLDKKANSTTAEERLFLKQLNAVLDFLKFEEYHVGGRINTKDFYVTMMQDEMFYFAIMGILLLLVFLYFTFRNVWGIIIPIVILIISLVWTLGLMQVTGQKMSLMMVMMPTMLFVIGVSDSVHIINKFRSEYKTHKDRKLAIRITVNEIGVAIFLTSITTAIGFISLCFMDVEPLIKFGIYTAIGIMFTYLVSILVIPSLLLVLKINFPEERKSSVLFLSWLTKFYFAVTNNKKAYTFGIILVILFSLNGLRYFKVNNNFLDDLDDSTSLKQDMLFFEDNFSGFVPFEIAIDVPEESTVLDLTILKEIELVENYLTDRYEAGFLVSPTTIVKSANMTLKGGSNAAFKLPNNEKKMKRLLKQLDRWKIAEKYKKIVTLDRKHGRLTAKIKDLGSSKVDELNEQLIQFITDNELKSTFIITGASHLLNESSRNVAEGVVKGIFLALLMMLITIAILFNSIKTAMISLLPNLLPVLILGGMMGYFGIDLKVSSSLMFTIVLGIAVDDTIHILAKYRQQSLMGLEPGKALYNSFLTTGWSVVVTSLIISSGFVIFLISDFESTFYTGLLVSVSLITALFSNIIILPLLLGRTRDIKTRKNKLKRS